jgi:hypothetical protein
VSALGGRGDLRMVGARVEAAVSIVVLVTVRLRSLSWPDGSLQRYLAPASLFPSPWPPAGTPRDFSAEGTVSPSRVVLGYCITWSHHGGCF